MTWRMNSATFRGSSASLILPVGFEPGRFHVDIAPNDPHAEKVYQSFEWSDCRRNEEEGFANAR